MWIEETKKESIEALKPPLENEPIPIEKSDNPNNKKDVDGSPSKKRYCPQENHLAPIILRDQTGRHTWSNLPLNTRHIEQIGVSNTQIPVSFLKLGQNYPMMSEKIRFFRDPCGGFTLTLTSTDTVQPGSKQL